MSREGVFVSIVTYNSEAFIEKCLAALFELSDYFVGDNLSICVVDNASEDSTCSLVEECFGSSVNLVRNQQNFGFSAGHNQAVSLFQESNASYFLVLNPDVALTPDALTHLVRGMKSGEEVCATTPLLLRCDQQLRPLDPPVIDAAGMVITNSLRHFDRGSGENGIESYQVEQFVFGGTGACLLLRREFIEAVSFRGELHEEDLALAYPELLRGLDERVQLFDEAFFAYREDADLAWRAQRLGWRYLYVPSAFAYHRRVVVPERRGELPKELNRLGVRNRFLLQLNNMSLLHYPFAIVPGVIFRNLLVILAVLFVERSSLSALSEVWRLRKRARERYRVVQEQSRVSHREASRWFGLLRSTT